MNTTRGICPVCGILVDAKVYTEDGKVYLEKYCLEHGKNTALISSDYDYYKNSHMFIKNGQYKINILAKNQKDALMIAGFVQIMNNTSACR